MKTEMPMDQPALSEAATTSIEDIGASLKPGEDREITLYVCKDDAGSVSVKAESEYNETESPAEDMTADEEPEPASARPKAVSKVLAAM